jgi:hypothetical protein
MTATNQPAKKFDENLRFEFLFCINNDIICQRFFNVRDYNEDVLISLELKELIDSIAGTGVTEGILPSFLKEKSVDFLWKSFDPYAEPSMNLDTQNKNDVFSFEIKVDKNTVAKTTFSGDLFPKKVKQYVDIRELIPTIMAEIRTVFSQKKYTKVKPIVTAYDIYYNKVSE